MVEHGEDVTGEPRERVVPVGVGGDVGAAVGAEVDGDRPVPVGQARASGSKSPAQNPVGVQQEQGLAGAARSRAAMRSPSCSTTCGVGSPLRRPGCRPGCDRA